MRKVMEYESLTFRALEQRLERAFQIHGPEMTPGLFSRLCMIILPEVWGGPDVVAPPPVRAPKPSQKTPKVHQLFGLDIAKFQGDGD